MRRKESRQIANTKKMFFQQDTLIMRILCNLVVTIVQLALI